MQPMGPAAAQQQPEAARVGPSRSRLIMRLASPRAARARRSNVCTAGQDLLSSGVVASCLEQLLQQPGLLLLAADKLSK